MAFHGHRLYGTTVHPGGTENFVEDDLIDAIDLRWRWANLRRRCTADYDPSIDSFATTWDLETVDDELAPAV